MINFNKKVKIAVLGSHFTWAGGNEFIRIILNGLFAPKYTDYFEIYLLLKDENYLPIKTKIKQILKNYLFIKNGKRTINNQQELDYLEHILDKINVVFYKDNNKNFLASLQNIKIDIVLPAAYSLGKSFPIPWVGYLYDFQHKYYPQFFTIRECLRRNRCFSQILKNAKVVITNSSFVKNDIDKFYSKSLSQVFNLPFAPIPQQEWFNNYSLNFLKKKYSLPSKYLIISNQFWLHKSHITAFKALHEINKYPIARDIHIVCTGRQHDYRQPSYFSQLMKEINILGLEKRIHFLGHIPKREQIEIMKNSLAVLQPTLFEGGSGGGSIYDAISLGLPCIVSDIPVNLEIKESNILFFKTLSHKDMAKKMLTLLNKKSQKPSKDQLIYQMNNKINLLGDRLAEVIDFSLNKA